MLEGGGKTGVGDGGAAFVSATRFGSAVGFAGALFGCGGFGAAAFGAGLAAARGAGFAGGDAFFAGGSFFSRFAGDGFDGDGFADRAFTGAFGLAFTVFAAFGAALFD